MVQTMHIGDFKARFSEVVELLKQGVTIKVVKGKADELVGYFGKEIPPGQKEERRLGFFSHLGIDIKKEDMQWSDEELDEMGL
ncbi:MAG: hypothetical protein IPJ13_21995 [Saprospiraceae bacterium]|jgi:hypothetical protein|nr:hypothetical protein [Saprospiraceae bacterium]MBP6448239.1 hypothetical protein [Saprospiraceae bacterium]